MSEKAVKAEKYLRQIRDAGKKLKSLANEIEALEYAASGQGAIRYDKYRVQTSPSNRMEEFIADAMEKREYLEELTAAVEELKVDAYRNIKKLRDTDERIMLEWYYINATSMENTIRKLAVSERKGYYIRDDALEHLGEVLEHD